MRLVWKIITESIGILMLTSLLSSIGGFGVEGIKSSIIAILPLLILMPALNDMTGDYGIIIASRFTTMLFEKKIKPGHWWRSHLIHRLLGEIIIIAVFSAVYITVLASVIAWFKGFPMSWSLFVRVLLIAVMTTLLLVAILFFICILGGFYVYKRKHDPDNYLIPLATGIADLGSMFILAVLVRMMF